MPRKPTKKSKKSPAPKAGRMKPLNPRGYWFAIDEFGQFCSAPWNSRALLRQNLSRKWPSRWFELRRFRVTELDASPDRRVEKLAKRMKPKCSACGSTGIRKINSTGKWYCDLHFDPFPGTSSGSLIRGAKIVPTPTDSHTGDEGRKLEAVRKLCEHHKDTGYGAKLLARCILKLLTPTAKGGRR